MKRPSPARFKDQKISKKKKTRTKVVSQSKKKQAVVKKQTVAHKGKNERKKPKKQTITRSKVPQKASKNKIVSSKMSANKKRPNRSKRRAGLSYQKTIGWTVVISIIVIFLLSVLLIRLPKVSGYAMSETLNDKDRVWVYRYSQIKRFDLVYFREPLTKAVTIRRVVGLPGEAITYRDEDLYINNELKAERFLYSAIQEAKKQETTFTEDFTLTELDLPTTVPENHYFLMGDNRPFSKDSRNYGAVNKKDIIGVVKVRFFPLHTMTQF